MDGLLLKGLPPPCDSPRLGLRPFALAVLGGMASQTSRERKTSVQTTQTHTHIHSRLKPYACPLNQMAFLCPIELSRVTSATLKKKGPEVPEFGLVGLFYKKIAAL